MSIERYDIVKVVDDGTRKVVGAVEIDVESFPALDAALTPVVVVDPDREADPSAPYVQSWLLSPRTTLETRPHREEPPFDYLDPVACRECGCTPDRPCVRKTAKSTWTCGRAEEDLCTACRPDAPAGWVHPERIVR